MRGRVPITTFVKSIHEHPVERVDGTAVYMFSATDLTPPSLMANLKHNNSLHEKIVQLAEAQTAAIVKVEAALVALRDAIEDMHER